jgi:hypothetical protein
MMKTLTAFAFAYVIGSFAAVAQTTQPFDGRPWHVSTGNLSVTFIQGSPIGAFPRANNSEAPPSVESQIAWREKGLVSNEDYVAWGAVESEKGKWNWGQHDAVERTMHKAGLQYVVYDWVHFPPVWLRGTNDCTLMRCVEHGKETNYLSIFDPRTIEWYDHFYKDLHAHFGDRIDGVYACILGPYGEGNYPLRVPDWVDMGHCHEGYWCGDPHAIAAFAAAMKSKYATIDALNRAWGATYGSFDEVRAPARLSEEKFKPTPDAFKTAQERRQWLDFITWYHQAIIDFAEQSVKTVLKYYPREKVRLKPGGTAGGINPIAWGTYSPGYAKMAGPYKIVLQPADCQGAVFADKWLGTAYKFYGVTLSTEPASSLDRKAFVRRMFSDISCGASQLFTYEFEQHVPEIQKYVSLYTGVAGETAIAVYCPTTLYRLNGDLRPTIRAAVPLRGLCEFDVLDELLIGDGALTAERYKTLLVFQGDVVDQPVLDRWDAFVRGGGRIIVVGDVVIRNVDGAEWKPATPVLRVAAVAKEGEWLKQLAPQLAGVRGCDGVTDGLWACRRGREVLLYNGSAAAIKRTSAGQEITVEPNSIERVELTAGEGGIK